MRERDRVRDGEENLHAPAKAPQEVIFDEHAMAAWLNFANGSVKLSTEGFCSRTVIARISSAFQPTSNPFAVDDGACELVGHAEAHQDEIYASVTEIVPAGFQLDSILVWGVVENGNGVDAFRAAVKRDDHHVVRCRVFRDRSQAADWRLVTALRPQRRRVRLRGHQRGGRRGVGVQLVLDDAEQHVERDQPLLRPVVQIPLELATRVIEHRNESLHRMENPTLLRPLFG